MKLQSIIEATKLKEGEERSEIKDLMIPHIKEYLERKGPGSFISMEDLESDLYDFARRITHDDLNSPQYLRDFMSNPGDEASSAVGELISGMYQAEFDDYITTEGRIEDTFGTKTIDKHDRPEKKKPKKEDIELNDNMIGEPDDFYGAEERQEAHKDLQDALQGNYMDDYIKDGSCPACAGSGYMDGEETFTNDSIASIMNKNFINIKVDREENPDVDQAYMTASQLMTGMGGWPLNVITLPDGSPVYAGTYHTTSQWDDILKRIIRLKKDNYDGLKAVSYTHLRAHETKANLVCRLML